MEPALRARIYCRGLLGFVAVVVHGNDLWTTSSALQVGRVAFLENESQTHDFMAGSTVVAASSTCRGSSPSGQRYTRSQPASA